MHNLQLRPKEALRLWSLKPCPKWIDTTTKLDELKYELLPYPLSYLDLTPSDYCLSMKWNFFAFHFMQTNILKIVKNNLNMF